MSLFIRQQPRVLCQLCRSQAFSTSYRRLFEQTPKEIPKPVAKTNANVNANANTNAKTNATTPNAVPPTPKKVGPLSPLADAPRSYGKRTEEFTPTPLSRPIGLTYPPEVGQNTGIDHRSLRQRRDDFVNWDKHLKRREYLYVRSILVSRSTIFTPGTPRHIQARDYITCM